MDTSIWTSFVEWLRGFGAQAGQQAADAGVQLGGVVGAQVVEGVSAAANRMDMPSLLALAAALGWASGFRLYAVVFIVGISGWIGWIPLPEGLQVLQHPALLATSGALLFVEFFADKIPGLDSLWDLVNSVIRIPAGAALAAGALGADSGTMAIVGALLGGSLGLLSCSDLSETLALRQPLILLLHLNQLLGKGLDGLPIQFLALRLQGCLGGLTILLKANRCCHRLFTKLARGLLRGLALVGG
jgi:hypothetical protein